MTEKEEVMILKFCVYLRMEMSCCGIERMSPNDLRQFFLITGPWDLLCKTIEEADKWVKAAFGYIAEGNYYFIKYDSKDNSFVLAKGA